MLILDNIIIPVSQRLELYSNVYQAWKADLVIMERIIGGEPLSIQEGAVLGALSAWHLYPDIVILGKRTKEVRLQDELIEPGGDNDPRLALWLLREIHRAIVVVFSDPITLLRDSYSFFTLIGVHFGQVDSS